MKTIIIIVLLFVGLSLYAQESVPTEPFSDSWPSEQQAASPNKAPHNPFDDFECNPDPNPVPIGDNFYWVLVVIAGYAVVRYRKGIKTKNV